ncbi:class I SAM-dependent methyltransferase [Dechloromonas sp. ZY10]|uniref:class I SAM-dependent methyltransferase n=1 Tax=Dechloromonas aquae TaxID=2664436 RepID=UPI003527E93E
MNAIIPPSPWLLAHAAQLPRRGCILDLACGRGRHLRWLAEYRAAAVASEELRFLAVDRDSAALQSLAGLPGVSTRCCDLEGENWPLAGERFAAVIVTNYLWRPRFDALLALLAPAGVLVYETFMQGNAAYGKPSRPDFLLQPGELRARCGAAGLQEIAFAEGYVEQPRPAVRQAIVARRVSG